MPPKPLVPFDDPALTSLTPFDKVQLFWQLWAARAATFEHTRFEAVVPLHTTLLSATLGRQPNTATARYSLAAHPTLCNGAGNLHGGAQALLFDVLTTSALAPLVRAGWWETMGVSRTLNVAYLRPVPEGSRCVVEVEVVAVGKRVATLRGVLRRLAEGEEGKEGEGVVCSVCEHGKANIDASVTGRL